MSRIMFTGIMPALLSPVNEDGSLRERELRQLVKALAGTGITGLYICGATGEGIALSAEVRMQIAEIVKDEAPANLKIINHAGAADLDTVRTLCAHSRKIGLDAISSVPPFFFGYDENGIIEYYREMSDASEAMPLLVYACPLSGTPLKLGTIEKMLSIPGFIGMKYTNPDYYMLSRYKKLNGGDINIINGPDETCLLGLMMGADGAIGSTYNVMPRLFVEIYNSFKSADFERARLLQLKADELIELLLKYDVVAGLKLILSLRGIDMGEPARPKRRLSEQEKQRFIEEFNALGAEQFI